MLRLMRRKLRRLYAKFWPVRRRVKHTAPAKRYTSSKIKSDPVNGVHTSDTTGSRASEPVMPIRIATFNAAMFSMAPVVPNSLKQVEFDVERKNPKVGPKSILKQQSLLKSNRRVSINLPDNEMSVERSRRMSSVMNGSERTIGALRNESPMAYYFSSPSFRYGSDGDSCKFTSNWTIYDVLREVKADIIGLQNVKAEEGNEMKPLSELAERLGMNYVFAESWAPEFGNAILSKWPIKQSKVQNICEEFDFRNVLKATIQIPKAGEVNFYCTHLDHFDEKSRMKQMASILQTSSGPHILVGGLNFLDETDYSHERWTEIVKYYEELGKPTPKVEVMRYLKARQYKDAKNFAGEYEAVVVLAKGQDVQGTCKYGTRVDYILASPNSPYEFIPGSYGVYSSKGTSDHHIVKADIRISRVEDTDQLEHEFKSPAQRVVTLNRRYSSAKEKWQTC